MTLRVTKEERAEIKDEFLFENENHIGKYTRTIIEYANSKVLLSEKNVILQTIGNDLETIETIAGNILFALATLEKGAIPLQSLAGAILPLISSKDSMTDRTMAMLTAMELLMVSKPYVEISMSRNGHLMIETMISDEALIMKNIVLPLTRPTSEHKELGTFNWKLTKDIPALEKLNHTAMLIMDNYDPKPSEPEGDRYSKAYLKQQEICSRWNLRQIVGPMYKDKPIYFNWAADYRARMYPVGVTYNPQGTQLEKNMLGFYNGEKLDYHGKLQLMKSISSAYGNDKLNDRLKLHWFKKNQDNLEDYIYTAKEEHTYRMLIKAWKDNLDEKEIHCTIGLD